MTDGNESTHVKGALPSATVLLFCVLYHVDYVCLSEESVWKETSYISVSYVSYCVCVRDVRSVSALRRKKYRRD